LDVVEDAKIRDPGEGAKNFRSSLASGAILKVTCRVIEIQDNVEKAIASNMHKHRRS